MKPVITFLIILSLGSSMFAGYVIGKSGETKFYDGDNNQIPDRAAYLLVKSEFVALPENDIDTLDKYFPGHQYDPSGIDSTMYFKR